VLAGLVPMVRAGWRGTAPAARPSSQAGLMAGSGLAVGLLAHGAGGLAVAGYADRLDAAALGGACRTAPRCGPAPTPRPVLAPVVLHAARWSRLRHREVELQNTSGDEHAHMAHYFDMAWVSVALVLVGALAALVPAARRRVLWLTGGLVLIGAARIAFTRPTSRGPLLAVALGRRRHPRRARGPPVR
jgi:hypothetical protein